MDVLKSRQLREQRAKLIADARELLSKAEATTEDRERYDRIMADVDKLAAEIARWEKLEDEERQQAKLINQPDGTRKEVVLGADEAKAKAERHERAFWNYIRHGERISPEDRAVLSEYRAPSEYRAQTVTTSGGGYLIPQGFVNQLEASMKAFGGMRQAATVFSTDTGNDLPWPTYDDTSNVGELLAINTAANPQDVTFGQIVFKAYKYSSKQVLVPIELMQDSAFDLSSMLAAVFGERIGRLQNQHFTTGDNSGKPQGVITGASSGVTAAATNAVTADELLDLFHSVDPAYRTGPKVYWMFSDSTFKAIRKLKDGQGAYLWQPGLRVGETDTLFGKPFIINQDCPSLATGNKPILFGDFSKYKIRDVMGISVLRLDERYAEYAQVGFVAFSRADGRTLDAGTDPIKYITMA